MKHILIFFFVLSTGFLTGCTSPKGLLISEAPENRSIAHDIHFVSPGKTGSTRANTTKQERERTTSSRPVLAQESPQSAERIERTKRTKANPSTSEPTRTSTSTPNVAQTAVPTFIFSEAESQDVRFRGRSCFSEGDTFELTLSDLAPNFVYPLAGNRISPYGARGRSVHTGIDLKAQLGESVYTMLPGVVRLSKSYGGYGNVVVVHHYNGLETVYAHLSKTQVKVNDILTKGAVLGVAGRTGRATTEHLHFEVRLMGESFNPELLLDTRNYGLQTKTTLYCTLRGGRVYVDETPRTTDPSADLATNEVVSTGEKTVAVQNTSLVKSTHTASSAPTKSATTYHKVRSGDTLYGISHKYGTTVRSLCKLNHLKENGILRLGMRLRIH